MPLLPDAESFKRLVDGTDTAAAATLARLALAPLGATWGTVMALRNTAYDRGWLATRPAGVPVVCVGNLTLGGTGKTPLVAWVVRRLAAQGSRPAIVSRGYGAAVGRRSDEAAELTLLLPGVRHVADRDRVAAATSAAAAGADIVVLDDGFQHRRLARDLDLVAIDATDPFGCGHVFPRGLLRERLSGLSRADAAILTRAGSFSPERRAEIRDRLSAACGGRLPGVWAEASHAPVAVRDQAGTRHGIDWLDGRRVAAFAGIGNPSAFRKTLTSLGAEVVAFRPYADHHAYAPADLTDLTDRRNGLRIQVTVKRGHTPEEVLTGLYTYTPLEDTFAASLVALDEDRVPRWWTVPELITAFLELRDSVVLNRSQHRLEKATERRHLVKGLITVQEDIDAAVAIIRKSADVDAARTGLMSRFSIDETQANYVLSMQLRRLTSQDVLELRKESEALDTEIGQLEKLVESRAARKKVIDKDLGAMETMFSAPGYARRTAVDTESIPVTRGSDGDPGGPAVVSDKWCLNDSGIFGSEGTLIKDGVGWAVFTDGRVKITDGKGLPKPGRDVLVAPDISQLLASGVAPAGHDLFLISRKGKILRLDIGAINPQGVSGNGVAGLKLADEDDTVVAAFPGTDAGAVLSISEKAYKVTALSDVPRKGRGAGGVGFHTFVMGEDAVFEAHGSETGFTRNEKPVASAPRARATTKGSPTGWTRA